jgi:hypothetical protein
MLEKTLPNNDLGYLLIVASLWGVELNSQNPQVAAAELASTLCDAELLEEIISTLPDEAQLALGALADAGGKLAWEVFTRRFGALREMGPGKRDREKPYQNPVSTTEILWYRALLARAFFETPKGLQEFAFIPDDLLEALELIGFKSEQKADDEAEQPVKAALSLPSGAGQAVARPNMPGPADDKPLGRPATPAERALPAAASDAILDEITTLLAAIRADKPQPDLGVERAFMLALLAGYRLIHRDPASEGWLLDPEAVREFFASPRSQVLTGLTEAWRNSPEMNDLRNLPGLVCEGGWQNDPLAARTFLLDLLALIPKGQWWSLTAFIRDLKTAYPDFQRQGGEYDTWFIKRKSDGLYLRGFACWDEVEGALVRYIVQILHWLGLADLARAQEAGPLSAFRLREKAETQVENGKISVASNGRISVPRLTPRGVRYQVARFCEWEESKREDEFRYRVTPESLRAAQGQGLKAGQLLSLLAKNAGGPIPPAFVKALQRWEVNGTETRVERLVVLRVSRPEVMSELKNSKAGRFLAEPLGPTAAVIKPGAESKILEALAEMGLLAEVSDL